MSVMLLVIAVFVRSSLVEGVNFVCLFDSFFVRSSVRLIVSLLPFD